MSKNIIAESHRIQKMYIFKKYFGVFFFLLLTLHFVNFELLIFKM